MSTKRRCFQQYLISIAVLLAALVSSLILAMVLPISPLHPWRSTLAALPMFPAALLVGVSLTQAIGLALKNMDELQHRIQLEAFALSLAGTSILTFALGLIQWWSEFDINYAFVPLIAAVFWCIGFVHAQRRYQ